MFNSELPNYQLAVNAPFVAAVILNYKNYGESINCARRLMQQDYPRLHCIIVDNASPNDSVFCLRAAFDSDPRFTILAAKSNGGYAAGNNLGVRWAIDHSRADYILIINPDVQVIEPTTVAQLVAFAHAHPDAGVVSPEVKLPDGFVQGPYRRPNLILICIQFLIPLVWLAQRVQHQRKSRTNKTPTRCFRTIGACMLLNAEEFLKAGMFDEGTFLENEEPILAERLLKHHKFFYHYPLVAVVHNHVRPGNSQYTITSLKYYFRKYQGYRKFAIFFLEACSKFYDCVYLPLKRRLPVTQ